MQIKTLQQRIAIFVLLPVFLILVGMGWTTFIMTRNAMLKQWSETAIAKLQKASHMVDMRLGKTKDLLLMLQNDGARSLIVREFIIDQLKDMEGVVEVNYNFPENLYTGGYHGRMHMPGMNQMRVESLAKFQFSLPRYDAHLNGKTISLSTNFIDENNQKTGQIEVVLSFEDLIDQISKTTWWKNNKAFLINNAGDILISTRETKGKEINRKSDRFAKTDPLEKRTLEALNQNSYGTLFGPGHPPKEISGYYHLNEAKWSLVLISPGKQVLRSILNFRLYYFLFGSALIIGVLLFIRMTITNTTRAIKKVSKAAKNLANGVFLEPLPVRTKDEVGELTQDFNKMTKQLKERLELKEAMHLAKEVQQSMLPPTNFSYENIEISGRSVYCDETGGDFFDIIKFPDPGKICVVVGDVVGHGIGAALLMATTRALVRSRVTQKGSLSRIMNDVNQLLYLDSSESGSFVTLFLMIVDVNKNELKWVRAGHDPAMVYNPVNNDISELYGEGLVLGLDEDWKYSENVFPDIPEGTVVLIGTDGTWEVENESGERFGKTRVKKVLQESSSLSSEKIVNRIISGTEKFRGEVRPNDDITLLVLKFL